MQLTKLQLKQVVGFCILMENGEGILSKSPKYIEEKMTIMQRSTDDWMIKGPLDLANQAKYDKWMERWKFAMPSEKE